MSMRSCLWIHVTRMTNTDETRSRGAPTRWVLVQGVAFRKLSYAGFEQQPKKFIDPAVPAER